MYSLLFESETFSKINEVTSSINKISVMMKDGPTHFFFFATELWLYEIIIWHEKWFCPSDGYPIPTPVS